MNFLELRKRYDHALKSAERIVNAAKLANRDLSDDEAMQCEAFMDTVRSLEAQIRKHDSVSTIHKVFPMGGLVLDPGPGPARHGQKPMSQEYAESFLAFLRSGGKQATSELTEGFDPLFGGYALPMLPGMSATAMYEGSNSAGGYAVSVPTDPQIVPLAVQDLGVRSVARVIATATDIKIPSQSTFGTAGIKAESGSSSNAFSESDPTLSQFTLSAYMMGLTHTCSWELLQDVQMFQEFAVRDLLNAIAILEDSYFVTGSGSGQPQGLVGNVGTGTGSAYAVESTGAYLLNAVLDVLGTVKQAYFPTAGWLMNRKTGTAIRRAQMQSNLFAPLWTRENGRDYLAGYPVTFSSSVPDIPTATNAGTTVALFGSFQDGYVIGDRGGSGIFVKILDQPLATSGQTVLLAYRRTDGRVRRSEAIQGISISHS